MKRSAIAASAALMVTLLAGCSAPAPSSTPDSDAETLVASSPSVEAGADESAFLAAVRENLPENTQIPDATDEQLLAAGADACKQIAQGTPGDQISVIENEQLGVLGTYNDSGAIVSAARTNLCD